MGRTTRISDRGLHRLVSVDYQFVCIDLPCMKLPKFLRKSHLIKVLRRDSVQAVKRIFMTSLVVGMVFVAGVPYLWSLPKAQVDELQRRLPPHSKLTLLEQSEMIDKYRNNLVGNIGTLATIVGGIVLFLNFRIAQERLGIDTAKIDNDAKLAESRLTTERFSKAVEQLGSENLHIRLGGIYSLEKLTGDSPSDYWVIAELLTAFIREQSPAREFWLLERGEVSTDVKAALTVISRQKLYRRAEDEELTKCLDLSYAYLPGIKLAGAYLESANLTGANLRGASFYESNLSGANFSDAFLMEAIFVYSDLSWADFVGANLERACFRESDLMKAVLIQANLNGTSLEGAYNLSEDQVLNGFLCETKIPKEINISDLDADRDCERFDKIPF